jgi:hypothetical protein
MPSKSSFIIYDKWQIDKHTSVRFYYQGFRLDQRRTWQIKRESGKPQEKRREVISEAQALEMIPNITPTVCIRYWDKETRYSTKIEQGLFTVAITIAGIQRIMSEGVISLIKRIYNETRTKKK